MDEEIDYYDGREMKMGRWNGTQKDDQRKEADFSWESKFVYVSYSLILGRMSSWKCSTVETVEL